MKLNEQLFTAILDFYPDWGNSPERFLEFISVIAVLSRLDARDKGTLYEECAVNEHELAEIFIREFNVDLSPYKNYAELSRNVAMNIDLEKVLERMRSRSRDEDAIYELAEEGGLQLSKETIINDLYGEVLIGATIDKLRPFIDFERVL